MPTDRDSLFRWFFCGASDANTLLCVHMCESLHARCYTQAAHLLTLSQQFTENELPKFTPNGKCRYWTALQVRNKTGITDIGLAANPDSYSFFGKCAFDLDREKSIFMAFAGKNTSMTATDRLQRNTKLLQILDETSNK